MKKRTYYHEDSLIERMMSPISVLIVWADAYFLVFWGKLLKFLDRTVEKEPAMEGLFVLSAVSGIFFVLKTISQRPELNFSQEETLKTCLAIVLAIGTLRFLCFHNMKRMKSMAVPGVTKAIRSLQPFRTTTSVFLILVAVFALFQTGKHQNSILWYSNGYFFLAICTVCAVLAIYAHSATIYLQISEKIAWEEEQLLKAEKLYNA